MQIIKNIMLRLSRDKNLLLLIILLVLPFVVLGAMALMFSSKQIPTVKKAAVATERFLDGYDWRNIEGLPGAPFIKDQIKGNLLRINFESSALIGVPFNDMQASLPAYLEYMDKLYSQEENLSLPVYFAVRLAHMAQGGAKEDELNIFRLAVFQKLKSYGLVK